MTAKSVVNHVSVEATATTDGSNATVNVKKILYLTNDGSGDLIVNLSNSGLTAGTAGAFTIKPNESYTDDKGQETHVGILYYKAASATAAFRFLGIPNDDTSAY